MRTKRKQTSKWDGHIKADPRAGFVELLAKALPAHGGSVREFLAWLRRHARLEVGPFRRWLVGCSAPALAFTALREDALALAGEVVREAAPPPKTPAQGCRAVAGPRADRGAIPLVAWPGPEPGPGKPLTPLEMEEYRLRRSGPVEETPSGEQRMARTITTAELAWLRGGPGLRAPWERRSIAPVVSRVPAMFAVMAAVAGPLKLSGKTIAVMAEQLAKPEVAREVFAQAAVLVALDTVNGEPRRGQP